MVRGFLRGGLVGALIASCLLMLLVLIASRRRVGVEEVVFVLVCAGFVGGGVGGVIGATRAAAPSRRWVFARRPARSLAVESAPASPDLRLRVSIAALYATAVASLATVVVIAAHGRRELTDLVNSAMPYAVGPTQARAMLAGTLFLCAFAALSAMSVQVTRKGIGDAERRLLAGAGFVSGVLALPVLGVVLG